MIRNEETAKGSVFGLRPNQISARIKQAAQAADLGDGYSGHSPQVGMARDLARAGTELPSLMNAGRWRSPAMPAHYTRNESAGKGAVAQFHGCKRGPASRDWPICGGKCLDPGAQSVLRFQPVNGKSAPDRAQRKT